MRTLIGILLWVVFVPGGAAVGFLLSGLLWDITVKRFRLVEPASIWVLLVILPAVTLSVVYGCVLLMKGADLYLRRLL